MAEDVASAKAALRELDERSETIGIVAVVDKFISMGSLCKTAVADAAYIITLKGFE